MGLWQSLLTNHRFYIWKEVGNGFIERRAAKKLPVETGYSNSILLVPTQLVCWRTRSRLIWTQTVKHWSHHLIGNFKLGLTFVGEQPLHLLPLQMWFSLFNFKQFCCSLMTCFFPLAGWIHSDSCQMALTPAMHRLHNDRQSYDFYNYYYY